MVNYYLLFNAIIASVFHNITMQYLSLFMDLAILVGDMWHIATTVQ